MVIVLYNERVRSRTNTKDTTMKTVKRTFTTEQAADIALAETFGYNARKAETHVKAPAQCLNLQPLLSKHNGPIGSGSIVIDLLAAWNKGFQRANLEG